MVEWIRMGLKWTQAGGWALAMGYDFDSLPTWEGLHRYMLSQDIETNEEGWWAVGTTHEGQRHGAHVMD